MILKSLNDRFLPYLEKSIFELSSEEALRTLYRRSGILAGEDFAYRFLDLEDEPDIYFSKGFGQVNESIFLPLQVQSAVYYPTGLKVSLIASGDSAILQKCQHSAQCEFVVGFFTAMVECYTNHPPLVTLDAKKQIPSQQDRQKTACWYQYTFHFDPQP